MFAGVCQGVFNICARESAVIDEAGEVDDEAGEIDEPAGYCAAAAGDAVEDEHAE